MSENQKRFIDYFMLFGLCLSFAAGVILFYNTEPIPVALFVKGIDMGVQACYWTLRLYQKRKWGIFDAN